MRSEASLKPPQAQTYIGEVKKNLQLSNKALQNLQAAHPTDPKVKSTIAKIETHHAKALKDCDMVDAECQKSKTDNVKLSDCCVDIAHELTAAQKETDALLKHLKIEALPPLKKSTDKTAPK
jgi:hypothetical protein